MLAAFAEFLNDEINMWDNSFDVTIFAKDMLLLWKYDLDKTNFGYVSDNDDPPRLKNDLKSADENELVNVG